MAFYFRTIFCLIAFMNFSACSEKSRIEDNIKNLDNGNYSILDSYLRDKFAVGLGEDTHGDGELFVLKTEIIEHLHKNLGFQAVLMESDFLAVGETIRALRGNSLHDAASMGVLNTWSDSKEFLKFIEYLKSTSMNGDTLYFHGFDSQMTGTRSLEMHLKYGASFEGLISPEAYKSLNAALTIIDHLDVSEISLDSLRNMRDIIRRDFTMITETTPHNEQWIRNVLGNLKILMSQKEAPPISMDNFPEVLSHPKYLEASSIRDTLMAENILYHMKKYDRVIIWAANNHLRYKTDTKNRTWMGEILKSVLGEKYYPILVLYDKGDWSYPNGIQKGVITKSDIGTLCNDISKAFPGEIGFLDLQSTDLPQKAIVRNKNWITADSVDIKSYTDALLFVRNATSSTLFEGGMDKSDSN